MAGTFATIKPTPAEILAALITVDGAGSGLDADLLDAQSSAAFESAGATATHAALTAAHGATGAVVGTTNSQVLSGKTLTTPTIADFTNAAHTHQDAAGGGQLATAALANNAITFAKMQDIATDRLIGRDTAATGDPEEISLGASLEWSGSASIQRAALTGDVTATANSNATTIANDAVTNAKLANMTTKTYKGRTAGTTGDPEDVAAATVAADIQASINHTAITNIGTNTHAQIDTHIAATAAHGATGAVVGETNSQTLTNKTLTTPTIGSFANAAHNHTNAAGGAQLTTAALSDYAAGAWTPTIIGTTGAPTSYTTQVGRYVKIGSFVTVWFNVTINVKGATMTGNVLIGNLPFTIANVASGFYPGSIPFWASLVNAAVFVGIYGVVTTTTAQVTRITAAATSMANMPVADLQNASRFVGTLSFEV